MPQPSRANLLHPAGIEPHGFLQAGLVEPQLCLTPGRKHHGLALAPIHALPALAHGCRSAHAMFDEHEIGEIPRIHRHGRAVGEFYQWLRNIRHLQPPIDITSWPGHLGAMVAIDLGDSIDQLIDVPGSHGGSQKPVQVDSLVQSISFPRVTDSAAQSGYRTGTGGSRSDAAAAWHFKTTPVGSAPNPSGQAGRI
jgi:hypothetical protein